MNIIIDGKICPATPGEMLLSVAARSGIKIPSLCHSDALPGLASCRICIVEILENGSAKVVTSCVYPVTREIEVLTRSPKILALRRTILTLLAAQAPHSPIIQELITEYGITVPRRLTVHPDDSCILCGLCVKACEQVGPSAIASVSRGISKKISTPYDEPSADCVGCNACHLICPTGAIESRQTVSQRTIWGKTFTLAECPECGRHFATREQLDYVAKQLGATEPEALCDTCRKQRVCAQLRKVHGY